MRAFGERRTVTLREHDVVILDFLRADTYGVPSDCPGSVMADITAWIAEREDLQDTRIGLDLWLVAESPDGTRVAPPDRDPTGTTGNPTDLTLENVRPGEALKVVLPAAAGWTTWRDSAWSPSIEGLNALADPANGVGRGGGSVRVDVGRFLEGSTVSVVVRPDLE